MPAPPTTVSSGPAGRIRVDPAVLQRAADEMARLRDVVADSRRGADGQVFAVAGRVGEASGAVLDGWRATSAALDAVEGDVATVAHSLAVLAEHLTALDRAALGPS